MMTMRPLLLALLLAVPALAQDPPPPPPPQDGTEPAQQPTPPAAPNQAQPTEVAGGVAWFPLDPNRRWVYTVTSRIESTGEAGEPEEATHSLDVYVADPQVVDGHTTAVLEWKLDGDLAQRCYFVTREEGGTRTLYCVKRIHGFGEHMKEYALAEWQPNAREDLAVGQEWTWQGKAGPTAGRQTFKVVREEEVVTPAGTYRALVLQIEFEGEDESRGTMTRWLARGIGIVREVSEVRTTTSVFRTEGNLVKVEGAGQ
jgi:hypothetical protein